MKNNLPLIYIILALILIGCQNENMDTSYLNNQSLEGKISIREYSSLMRKATAPGGVLLQSNDRVFNQNVERRISIFERTEFGGKKQDTKKLNMSKKDGSVLNIADSNQDLEHLFGSTITLTTLDKNFQSRGGPIDSTEVYVPQLLTLTLASEFLEPGALIEWNVDELNQNGLVVYVVYDPKSQPDVRIAFNNQKRIIEAFTIPDAVGSYELTQEDLQRFPDNSSLNLNVARSGFFIEEGNPSFVSVTKVSDDKILKK